MTSWRFLTSATKKRTTTSETLIAKDCIHVFLIAIRSAKWFVADKIPIKTRTGWRGNGLAFHISDISITLCGEKLGWEIGSDVAKTECTSTSPLIANPVASSSVYPCRKDDYQVRKIADYLIKQYYWCGVTYCTIWEWCHMATSNIYMVSINSSTYGQDKQFTLHKRKWPSHFRFLSTSYKSLEPWRCAWFFWIDNIITHPFFASWKSINCQKRPRAVKGTFHKVLICLTKS